jgi:Tol biopolymer transport system component
MTLPADVQLSGVSSGSLSVSPDGRTLVFVAQKGTGTGSQLWLRTLDSTNVKPLTGTEGGSLPFWSPDAAHVAFFAGGKLKRMDLRTSAVTTICDAADPGGGTWNAEDTIVFSPMIEGPLFRVSAGGGTPSQLTTLDAAEVESNHMWPHFLPDGRHYLFQVLGLNNRGIYAGTLDGPARTLVIRQDGFDMTAVQYSSSGHLVYVRNHQLVARPFDVEQMTVAGDETALADGFGIGGPGRPQFSISRTGVLAFRPVGDPAIYQPTWFSRSGVQQGTLGTPGPYGSMELSKDGRTLAFDQFTEKESSTWLLDLARGTAARFTSDAYSVDPVWFPDGDRLAYVSVRDTPPNPFMKTMAGVETRLARLPKAVALGSVTPDGATILGGSLSPGTHDDLWLFPTTPDATPTVFLQTPFNESTPRLSPDGRWVAFTSDESGTNEIYVTTFPKAGRRHRVSADVGTNARWSADGKEIIFRSRLRLMSATFTAPANGEPSIGAPRVLFTLPEGTAPNWVVADNGQRFLFNLRVTARQPAPMTVMLNWPAIVRGK